jgi:hypothetical protein
MILHDSIADMLPAGAPGESSGKVFHDFNCAMYRQSDYQDPRVQIQVTESHM